MTPAGSRDVAERRTPGGAPRRVSADQDGWLGGAARGLDTLPAPGVVLVALGVVLEDVVFAGLGIMVGAAGVALEIVLARAALHGLGSLL